MGSMLQKSRLLGGELEKTFTNPSSKQFKNS